jgi:hypothetical protein
LAAGAPRERVKSSDHANVLEWNVERVFLLSPARAQGQRARMIFSPRAGFDLARRLQRGESATLSEVFTFLSGLYFRGKIAYARAFAKCEGDRCAIWVITTNRGLVNVDEKITLSDLQEFSDVDIDHEDPRYRKPLERSAKRIRREFGPGAEIVLLGSISTKKYVDCLLDVFGPQLKFPIDLVGRGDMSRGGLLLRSAVDEQELEYVPVLGATRRGKRPPKLTPRRYTQISTL